MKTLSITNPWEMFSLIIKVAFSWRIVFSDFSTNLSCKLLWQQILNTDL